MPRSRVRANPRKETLRTVGFVATLLVLMAALLGGGTLLLEHLLREDAADAIAAQVSDPTTPLAADQLSDIDYVAMGDSYSAGPGLPVQTDPSCRRSSNNYPSLLAQRLAVASFTDVTCSGARTLDITADQARPDGVPVPPQLEALDRDTDLVTLSIGGNDESVFNSIVTTCPQVAAEDPTGSPCRDALAGSDTDAEQRQTDRIASRVAAIVRTIRQRAPQAQVVVVGYPAIFPASGPCEQLPFAEGDVVWAAQVVEAVVEGMREAADNAGVRFVDLRAASAEHHVCSEQPWVTGVTPSASGADAWHPVPRGMKGIAEVVQRQLVGS